MAKAPYKKPGEFREQIHITLEPHIKKFLIQEAKNGQIKSVSWLVENLVLRHYEMQGVKL